MLIGAKVDGRRVVRGVRSGLDGHNTKEVMRPLHGDVTAVIGRVVGRATNEGRGEKKKGRGLHRGEGTNILVWAWLETSPESTPLTQFEP